MLVITIYEVVVMKINRLKYAYTIFEVMKMNIFNNDEIPVGLSMALAENLYAMERFGNLNEQQQQDFIQQSRNVGSKQEMRSLVSELETMK